MSWSKNLCSAIFKNLTTKSGVLVWREKTKMQKIGGIWEDRDYICNKIEKMEELSQIDAKY